jgi:hypothetical protein
MTTSLRMAMVSHEKPLPLVVGFNRNAGVIGRGKCWLRIAFVLFLLFVQGAAQATCYSSPQYRPTQTFPSYTALCNSWFANGATPPHTLAPRTDVPAATATYCAGISYYQGSLEDYPSIAVNVATCPPLQCPNVEALLAVARPRLVSGLSEAGAKGLARDAAKNSTATCVKGCLVVNYDPQCGGKDGVWFCQFAGGSALQQQCGDNDGGGILTSEGFQTKTYEPAPSPSVYDDNQASAPPPKGTCPGQVNGITIYVKCDSSVSASSTSTTSSVGGSATSTISSETTTSCKDGTCTSTVTGTRTVSMPDGTTSSTPTNYTATLPQDDFCKSNPKDKSCLTGKESSFGGTCNAGFVCDGDAATCAIAEATNKTNCSLAGLTVDATNTSVVGGLAAINGQQGTQPHDNISQVNVGSFDQSNPWASSCPGDYTISLVGVSSITVPLSSACSIFQMLGSLLVGLTLLGSAMFVIRGA